MTTQSAQAKRITEQLHKALTEIAERDPYFADILGYNDREPRWRCYGPRGALRGTPATVYAWSTERVGGKFKSWIYRYIKRRKEWVVSQERSHVRRTDAKARALALWQAKKGGNG